jgi:hypothetical protein
MCRACRVVCVRHRLGVLGVDDAEGGLEPSVGDARLGVAFDVVEDRHARGLTAGARRRGDGDERLQRARRRLDQNHNTHTHSQRVR